jgi:hypothetical protein
VNSSKLTCNRCGATESIESDNPLDVLALPVERGWQHLYLSRQYFKHRKPRLIADLCPRCVAELVSGLTPVEYSLQVKTRGQPE